MLLRRTAQIFGLLGGLAWVVRLLVDSTDVSRGLYIVGAFLITLALVEIGLLLVKKGLIALRLFVALACPLLVWAILLVVYDGVSDTEVVDAVVGALMMAFSGYQLVRGSSTRATL
jgi:hypothetical protein